MIDNFIPLLASFVSNFAVPYLFPLFAFFFLVTVPFIIRYFLSLR